MVMTNLLKTKRCLKSILITLVLVLVVTLFVKQFNPLNFGSAHSSQATPTEIFSLWNDTTPTIDGQIYFNSSSLKV